MKKKKQDEVSDAMIPAQAQDYESSESHEDNIRSRVNAEGPEFSFKKSLYGYEIQDVDSYIEQQNENLVSVCRVYDAKIKDLKNELALCYRERDSLKVNYESCRKELETAVSTARSEQNDADSQVKTADVYAEYEKNIGELNEKLAKALYENEKLAGNQKQVADLTNKNALLEGELASLRQKNNDIRLELAKLVQLTAENERLFAENTALKAERADVEKKLSEAVKLSGEKEVELQKLTEESDIIKRDAAELEIKRSVLQKQSERDTAEIEKLREDNKKQAYEFASKVNQLESDYTNGRLAQQKQMQVHSYHIKQMEVAIEELNKQFSEVKISLEGTDISK